MKSANIKSLCILKPMKKSIHKIALLLKRLNSFSSLDLQGSVTVLSLDFLHFFFFFTKVKGLKDNFEKTDTVEERIRRDRPPARTSQAERKKKVNEWNKQATRQVPLIHP
jgi:hypothetical protein